MIDVMMVTDDIFQLPGALFKASQYLPGLQTGLAKTGLQRNGDMSRAISKPRIYVADFHENIVDCLAANRAVRVPFPA